MSASSSPSWASAYLGVPGTEEAGEGTEEEACEWEEEVPEAELEAPRDMMEVRPDESTLPTAGSRIWGNWQGVNRQKGGLVIKQPQTKPSHLRIFTMHDWFRGYGDVKWVS